MAGFGHNAGALRPRQDPILPPYIKVGGAS